MNPLLRANRIFLSNLLLLVELTRLRLHHVPYQVLHLLLAVRLLALGLLLLLALVLVFLDLFQGEFSVRNFIHQLINHIIVLASLGRVRLLELLGVLNEGSVRQTLEVLGKLLTVMQ